jgi:hypothetical protein
MQIAGRRGMKKAIWLWHAGAAIGVYAAIRREKGEPFGFPEPIRCQLV